MPNEYRCKELPQITSAVIQAYLDYVASGHDKDIYYKVGSDGVMSRKLTPDFLENHPLWCKECAQQYDKEEQEARTNNILILMARDLLRKNPDATLADLVNTGAI